jgi:hypothetical protein
VGKSSDEIQVDVERQRQSLKARVSRLDRRVRDDVDEVRGDISDKVSDAKESVSGFLTSTRGADSAITGHPGVLLTGSAAVGAVLGWTGGARGRDRRDAGTAHAGGRRTGLRRLFSAVTTSGVSVVATEATQVAKSVASGALRTARGGGEKQSTRYAPDTMPEPLTSAHAGIDPRVHDLVAAREAALPDR